MNSYVIYILKVCLGISFFVIPYYFFLRNDTSLSLKRFFLLSGVFASFLFPFLILKGPQMIESYSPAIRFDSDLALTEMSAIPVESSAGFAIYWPTVMIALYLCGMLILLFRNVFLFLKWNTVWNKADSKSTGIAYSGNDDIFAMFSRIFLPHSLQNTKDLDSILLHEKAHIRQLHYIDLIILEFTLLLTWFNPFTWLLILMVKENHEHLADRLVLQQGIDSTRYRAQLINQTMGVQVFSLAYPFNHSSIKKRFEMMKKSGSIRSGLIKVALLLPLILVSLGFAVGKARQGNVVNGNIVFSDTGEPAHGTSIVVKNTTTGTVADAEGSYKLELNERAEVVFSFVGYKTQSYWFNPGEYRFVVMEREVIDLKPPASLDVAPVRVPKFIGYEPRPSDKETPKFIGHEPRPSDKEKSEIQPQKFPDEEEVFYIVEEMPKFNGGDPAVEFRTYLAENLRYPAEEAKNKVSGRVIVQFTIQPDGNVADVKVLQRVSEGLDKEAKRVVEESPAWTPGRQRGKTVSVMFTFPINFNIQ